MNETCFMLEAIKEAKKALINDEVPVGAVIVKDNKIIARGYNKKEKNNCVIDHAEIVAIKKASKKMKNWRLNECSIYVTMFPCPMCASAINQSRISNIVYGTVPEYVNKQIVIDILNDNKYGIPVKICESIMKNECTELIKKFFKKKR